MREQVVMGPSSWMLCAAVTLTLLWGALCAPSCPSPCLCEGGWLINCSSVGPSLSSLLLQISVTTLDLSRNSLPSLPLHPHQSPLLHLTHLHLGQNRLTDLSVCEAPPTGEGQCETWTPNLELLSAERNQLQHIPKGLCGATALHTLHLSYNRISALRVGDLQGCAHLRELHLQHNLISTLEPLVFRELLELRTLDLSFNALSTFPVPAYLSLSSLRVQVEVGGNPWRCDCSLQALRSWMGVTHNTLRWQLQCAEPPDLAGRDFLLLHDTDLTCDTPTVGMWPHQEVTVHLGTEILLPCGVPDQDFSQALWWTPNGSVRQASVEHGGGLMIQHISEQDQGLYVCISGPNQEPTSMFTVRVRAGARGGAEPGLRSGKRTHDELALAVCLSVFLTFIAAFAIGALTRPYLDTLWEKVQAWRRPVSTPTPYENAGFAEEEVGPEAERAGLGDASKPYYITIIPETDGSQCPPSGTETDTAAKEEGCSGATYENVTPKRRPAPQPTPRQSQGEEPCHQGRGADQSVSSEEEEEPSHPSRTIEFEPIPDPKDLGIEELSTTESDQSNQDLSLESHQDLNMDSAPDHDSKHDLGPNLEQKPDDDLGPELDLHRVAPCDPFSISREDLETDWLKNTRSPGENPFPAPAWTDSPWEPHPNVAQTPPQDGIQPDLDPELWNDSGESFEFTDSLQEESTRGGSSLAQQLKERPWSPFHQSVALQQVSNDPAVLRGQPQEGEGQPLSLSGWASPSSSSSSEESDQPTEHMPSPEITAIYPENTTIHPDNTVLHPVNTVIHSNDTALNPENTALHREDTTIHPDNAALHPESTEIHPKNTAFYPEVTPIYPQNQPLHPKNPEIHSENTAIHQEDPRYEGPTGPLLLTDMTHPQLTGSGRADAPWVISAEDQADVEMGSYFGIEMDLTRLKTTVAHPLVSCDSEGHGYSTIVSGLTAVPWSSQRSVQGPVGRHISYGDTDQDPTLGAAPGPVKPRRSFKQQTNPLATLQQEETSTPLHPVHQEDMPTHLHPVHQEDMPTPLQTVHQEDMHTPLRPIHQEDMPTPLHPVHQEDMPTPLRLIHQEDMHTPLHPVHQEDMPTPLHPIHQEDMPTPLRPIYQEDMPTPLRPIHKEDMHTPLRPIHQEDMPTPLHPVHQEDMPTPLRPIHKEDMHTPLRPIHQEDMPTPLHPVHKEDMLTPPQPIQQEDMPATLQPFQEDTLTALQLLQQDATSTPFQPIQPEVMLTLQQQIQREDILIPLQPTQQEDMPTTLQPFQQEDTLTALRSIQQDEMPTPVFPSHTLHPAIQFDTQRKEPIPFEAPLTTPTQGSQRQDWRRGGQFFQRRRVIDTFSTDPQASSQPGSAQLTFSQVTVVTTATDERRSQWFRLGEGGEEQTSAATAEEGHVTSDPMSGFLFGTSNDKGSEA